MFPRYVVAPIVLSTTLAYVYPPGLLCDAALFRLYLSGGGPAAYAYELQCYYSTPYHAGRPRD